MRLSYLWLLPIQLILARILALSRLRLNCLFPSILTLGFTSLILVLEIFTSYRVYSRILIWLALTLLAYPLTLFIIDKPWQTIIAATFLPHVELNFEFFFIITGVLGTTISPYMFFWQASQEVEEEKELHLTSRYGKLK